MSVFNNWKSQLLQPLGRNDGNAKPQGDGSPEGPEEDPQVLRLRRMLADLRGADVAEQPDVEPAEVSVPTRTSNGRRDAGVTTMETRAGSVPAAAARTDATLTAMLGLLAEQRELAEALLQECSTLEERLRAGAMAMQADREYAEATEKANVAALLGRQSQEAARAASERRDLLTSERQGLDELIATARAEHQAAQSQVTEAELLLREAQELAAELAASLDRHETRAAECVADEGAAASEEREATELVASFQAAYLEAEKAAQSAKERAEALKTKHPPAAQSIARIGEIEDLAKRIAGKIA